MFVPTWFQILVWSTGQAEAQKTGQVSVLGRRRQGHSIWVSHSDPGLPDGVHADNSPAAVVEKETAAPSGSCTAILSALPEGYCHVCLILLSSLTWFSWATPVACWPLLVSTFKYQFVYFSQVHWHRAVCKPMPIPCFDASCSCFFSAPFCSVHVYFNKKPFLFWPSALISFMSSLVFLYDYQQFFILSQLKYNILYYFISFV